MTDSKKFRTFVKSFAVHVGPATLRGSLVSVQASESKEGKARYVAPNGNPVKQKYQDVVTGDLYETSELGKAVDDTVVDKDALAEAKKGVLPKDIATVSVHLTSEVGTTLFHAPNNSYVLVPDTTDPTNKVWYDVVAEAIKDTDYTYITLCNVRNSEGIYQLISWRGYIVLQRMLFPDRVNDHDIYETDLDPQALKLVPMIAGLVEPFNPDAYQDTQRERVQMVIEAAENGTAIPAAAQAKPAAAVFDADAAMAAFAAFKKEG